MLMGAIVGDIAGSRFERHNLKSKAFELFTPACGPTDDSTMTLAVALALLRCDGDRERLPRETVACMQDLGRRYPFGYGRNFYDWLHTPDPEPYGSWGNGAAMRVSPCAWAASSLEEALALSDIVTAVSHDHPEALKGARAVTTAIWLARQGAPREAIRGRVRMDYYPLDFTLDQIRPFYGFDVSCQGSVPQAIEAFLEAEDFEDAVRNAISIGGDSDTIGAIAGSIAEAAFGVPEPIATEALTFLDPPRREIVEAFTARYGG